MAKASGSNRYATVVGDEDDAQLRDMAERFLVPHGHIGKPNEYQISKWCLQFVAAMWAEGHVLSYLEDTDG